MNEKENHLPNLSDKERAHALELAMKARKRRAVLKAHMKSVMPFSRMRSRHWCEQGGSHQEVGQDSIRPTC